MFTCFSTCIYTCIPHLSTHLPSGDTTIKTFRSLCTFSTFFTLYAVAWLVVNSRLTACQHNCRPLLWHSDASGIFSVKSITCMHSHHPLHILWSVMPLPSFTIHSMHLFDISCTVLSYIRSRNHLYSVVLVDISPLSRLNVWGGCGSSPATYISSRHVPNGL